MDESYGQSYSSDETEIDASQKFLEVISKEFSTDFEEVDIGPGASIPAFLTLLAESSILKVVGAAFGIFLMGKPINDNLEAWSKLAQKIKRFSTRNVCLNRNGAAVVAVDAAIKYIGELPRSVKLLGYSATPYDASDYLVNMEVLEDISKSIDNLYIGTTVHIFDLEIDHMKLRVLINGDKSRIVKFKTPLKH